MTCYLSISNYEDYEAVVKSKGREIEKEALDDLTRALAFNKWADKILKKMEKIKKKLKEENK